MSTIHWRLAVLAPRALCSGGRATLSDEFPATITTRLRQRTPRLHQRLSYTAFAVGAVTGLYSVRRRPVVPVAPAVFCRGELAQRVVVSRDMSDTFVAGHP